MFNVSIFVLWYLNNIMSSIDLATRLKNGMYLLNRQKRCNAFSKSTDRSSKLPTDNRHNFIKVPQDRLSCCTHIDNKKTGF